MTTIGEGRMFRRAILGAGAFALAAVLLTTGCAASKGPAASKAGEPGVVRVAVIGGMTMTPLWGELQKKFEAKTGLKVKVIATGEKGLLADALQRGEVDYLTMHSSDRTSMLVADGYGTEMRPWAENDLVIVGPVDDPAHIAGLKSGAEAVKKIAESKSNYIDFQSNGPRETAHSLFAAAGVRMAGPWVLNYDNTDETGMLHYVAREHAYMICGRMPILFKKWDPDPGVKIMVEGDPAMRRPYMEMIANPAKFPKANVDGARKLSDFLVSDEIQKFLATYDGGIGDGVPIFHPLTQGS